MNDAPTGEAPMSIADVGRLAEAIRGEVGKAIVGQAATVDHMLVALLARGHVLLEGPPGTAKTFLAQCFAASLGLGFGRIQFTPDLMPGDILGSNLFNFQTSQFTLTRGPIFCDLLLADGMDATLTVQGTHSSSFQTATDYAPGGFQKGYWLLNASASVSAGEGQYELALIGRNLTNTYYMLNVNGWSGSGNPNQYVGFFNRPREVVLQGTVKF